MGSSQVMTSSPPPASPTSSASANVGLKAAVLDAARRRASTGGVRPECFAQASTNDRLETLERIAELASELCNAVDCESEDVGGARPSLVILREIGPLADRLAKRSTPALPAHAEAAASEPNGAPSVGLLVSMAIRLDHGLGCPGYYDSPAFSASGLTHKRRLEAAMSTARQLWEEVAGVGFYSPAREAYYVCLTHPPRLGEPSPPPAQVKGSAQ